MAEEKIIAVIGATGAQGAAILADPPGGFAARAITRDANSEKAKALATAGPLQRGDRMARREQGPDPARVIRR